jgi:anti-sigma B factor antagonist
MPPLKVKIKRDGRAVIVAVSGELDIASAPALTERARRALEIPADQVVLDLSGLTFIDCAGGRALTGLASAAPPGCSVVMRGASHRVRKVLAVVGAPAEPLDVPVELPGALEPAEGVEPTEGVEPAGAAEAAERVEQRGSRARERNTWLLLEAQVLVSWAEQACLDSKNAIVRARASRTALTDRRSLAQDGAALTGDGAALTRDGGTLRRDGAAL